MYTKNVHVKPVKRKGNYVVHVAFRGPFLIDNLILYVTILYVTILHRRYG